MINPRIRERQALAAHLREAHHVARVPVWTMFRYRTLREIHAPWIVHDGQSSCEPFMLIDIQWMGREIFRHPGGIQAWIAMTDATQATIEAGGVEEAIRESEEIARELGWHPEDPRG